MAMNDLQTILLAIFGSTGLWTLINFLVQRHFQKKDQRNDDLALLKEAELASLQDRLLYLCESYIEKGSIELNQLQSIDRLYTAYRKLGGNSFISDMYDGKVKRLSVRNQ